MPSMKSRSVRTAIGAGLLGVGALALVLPGAPGTPFLLAGAWFLPKKDPWRKAIFKVGKRCLRKLAERFPPPETIYVSLEARKRKLARRRQREAARVVLAPRERAPLEV
jgi:hypothetical protein